MLVINADGNRSGVGGLLQEIMIVVDAAERQAERVVARIRRPDYLQSSGASTTIMIS